MNTKALLITILELIFVNIVILVGVLYPKIMLIIILTFISFMFVVILYWANANIYEEK